MGIFGIIGWSMGILTFFYRERERTTYLFGLLSFLLGIWGFGYTLLILAFDSFLDQIAQKITFFAICFVAPLFLIFGLSFGGEEWFFQKKYLSVLVFVLPLLDYLIIFTNDIHNLVFIDPNCKYPFLTSSVIRGSLFWIHQAIIYGLLGMSLIYFFFLYLRFKRQQQDFYRWQVIVILLGCSFPLITNIIQVLRIFSFSNMYNITPFSYFLTLILVFFGAIYTRFLEVVPIAHGIIIDELVDNYLVLDAKQQIIDHNKQLGEFLSVKSKKLIGKKFEILIEENPWDISKKQVTKIHQAINEVINEKGIYKEFELERLKPDQIKSQWLLVKIRPAKKVNTDTTIGCIISIEDITQTKEVELALKESNILKSILIGMLSHDLRNNIGIIQGNAELGLMIEDAQERRKILSNIFNKCVEVGKNLSTVIEFIKMREEVSRIQKTPINIIDIISENLNSLAESIEEKDLKITLNYPNNGTIPIFVPANLALRSVFYNIIHNAIKFSPNEANITINIEEDSKSNWITVIADEGEGIPDELKEEVFKPFKKFSAPDKSGTGLGLTIVYEAIKIFGGEVWIEDNKPRGTKVYCKLPKFDPSTQKIT
ncbi:MAG: histidine kinase N-terminal 7TM domain-containing protein [Promethearchaeota archaeon]